MTGQPYGHISPLFLVGAMFALCGALVRLWSYRALGVHFTFQLTIQQNHELVTTGPYAYVRHPSYTALIMTFVGVVISETSGGSWWTEARVFHTPVGKGVAVLACICMALTVLVVSRAPKEDEMLSNEFGERWVEWKRKAPCRFVPGIL